MAAITGSSAGTSAYSSLLVAQAMAGNTGTATTATPAGTGTSSAATNVTLSDTARAALAAKDYATVIAEARAALSKIMTDAGKDTPIADGKLTVDLSSLDRRALFALAANGEGKFSTEEQQAAALDLQNRFDAALAGPAAVMRVTGDYKGLYSAAAAFLDGAGEEQKATPIWKAQREAVAAGLKQLETKPDAAPTGIAGDPVAAYLNRAAGGQTGQARPISDVASDVRTALDKQYAAAKAAGTRLIFSTRFGTGQQADLSAFDSRSLSSIALNTSDKFNETEQLAAKRELRSRSNAAMLAGLKQAGSSSDPTAFAKNLMSMYGSLSTEERQATGLNANFYQTVLDNYRTSSKIAQMIAGMR